MSISISPVDGIENQHTAIYRSSGEARPVGAEGNAVETNTWYTHTAFVEYNRRMLPIYHQ